jgi:hypothetical protein
MWRVFLSIGVRIIVIRCVVYFLRIFKILHGLMNNLVFTRGWAWLWGKLIGPPG